MGPFLVQGLVCREVPGALQPPAPGLGSCPAQAGQGAKLPRPREHPASSWWHVVGCPAQLRTWHRLPGCGSCSGEALGTPTPSHGASTALMASRCCVPASSTSAPHHAVVPALPESHQDPPQPRGEAPSSASPAPAPGVLLWGQRCWGRVASAQRGHRRHLDPGPASPEPGARGGLRQPHAADRAWGAPEAWLRAQRCFGGSFCAGC